MVKLKSLKRLRQSVKRNLYGKKHSMRKGMNKYKTRRAYSNRNDKQYPNAHKLKGRKGKGRHVYSRNQ